MAFEFNDVHYTDHVEGKINGQHHTSIDEVAEALENLIRAKWDTDERGRRLLVYGTTDSGRRLLVVLYPVNEYEGVWRLGSAYPE